MNSDDEFASAESDAELSNISEQENDPSSKKDEPEDSEKLKSVVPEVSKEPENKDQSSIEVIKDTPPPGGGGGGGTSPEFPDDGPPSQDKREEDVTTEQPTIKTQSTEEAEASSEGGWGWGWGKSLWSTDPLGQLGQGISSVIHKVEEGLGINEKEDKDNKMEATQPVEKDKLDEQDAPIKKEEEEESSEIKEEKRDPSSEQGAAGGWSTFGWDISALTTASKGFVSSGLDALEIVGKKTMNMLSEGDPGLRRVREKLGSNHSTLSDLIREAKERTDNESKEKEEEEEWEISFSLFFDEYQGLVHLEALELLSKDASSTYQLAESGLVGKDQATIKETLEELKKYFEEDVENEDVEVGDLLEELGNLFKGSVLPLKMDKLVNVIQQWRDHISLLDSGREEKGAEEEDKTKDGKNIIKVYEDGIRSLAQIISCTIEIFRKCGELVRLPGMDDLSVEDLARRLRRLTFLIGHELSTLTESYTGTIQAEESEEAKGFATSLFLEASRCNSHVEEAFKLLLPILELRVVNCQ